MRSRRARWAIFLLFAGFVGRWLWSLGVSASIDPLMLVAAASQLLQMILGSVVSIEPEWTRRNRVAVLVGFVTLGIVGTSAAIMSSVKSARETATANTKLADSLDNLGKSSKEISDKTERISELNQQTAQIQERLLESTRMVAELSKQSFENITGGNAFAYVVPQTHAGLDALPLVAVNNGNHLLTGVEATIHGDSAFTGEGSLFTSPRISVGVLHPHQGKSLTQAFIRPAPDSAPNGVDTYHIFISAQNGSVWEVLQFRKSKYAANGMPWAYRFKVTSMGWGPERRGVRTSRDVPLMRRWEWSDDLGDGKPTK